MSNAIAQAAVAALDKNKNRSGTAGDELSQPERTVYDVLQRKDTKQKYPTTGQLLSQLKIIGASDASDAYMSLELVLIALSARGLVACWPAASPTKQTRWMAIT